MVGDATHKVLYVFLASPGDLIDERAAVRHIVDELNGTLHRTLHWHIELLGWEDIRPGFGRPQGLIDRDVDRCHLFLGTLWKRWGTPTGEYSSGFEEEFERALARRRRTGDPEIWLCFKHVAPDLIKDPGEDLKKVLTFRDAQIAAKHVLFKDYDDYDGWTSNLRTWLLEYVLERAMLQEQPPAASSAAVSETPQQPTLSPLPAPVEDATERDPATRQLLGLTATLSGAIERTGLHPAQREGERLDRFHIARLRLLSTALMARYTEELIATRDINLLYVFKERLAPTLDETALLARTLIVDPYDVAAGWYWFADVPDMRGLLFYFAALDSVEEVRVRTIDLIARAAIPPQRRGVGGDDPLDRIVNDDASGVRVAGLRYVEIVGAMGHLSLVGGMLSDDDPAVQSAARRARWAILARDNPGLALSELRDNPQDEAQAMTPYIEGGLAEGGTAVLTSIARDRRVAVGLRALVLRELARRGESVRGVVSSLLDDPSKDIRRLCCELLIGRGETLDPARVREMFKVNHYHDGQAVLLALHRAAPPEALLGAEFYSVDGPIAYRALALDHFPLVAAHIRSDLADQFARRKGAEMDALRAKLGDEAGEILKGLNEEADLFLVRMYTSAALSGLAAHGEPGDVDIARRYLADPDVDIQAEAVKIVARFGDRSDVPSLLGVIEGTYDKDLRLAAADAALRLDPGATGAAAVLAHTTDAEVIGVAISSLRHVDAVAARALVRPLLNDKRDETRIKALAYVVGRSSTDELTALLGEYVGKRVYYYNVVCWLDRILFAPSPLRETFRRELIAHLPGDDA